MKSKLHIKTHSLRWAVLFILGTYAPIVQGQIIYTDIDPDFTSAKIGDLYNLDLNNDQIVDFTLQSLLSSGDYLKIEGNPNGFNGIISFFPWESAPVPLENSSEVFNIPYSILYGYSVGYDVYGIFFASGCSNESGGCYFDWKDKNDRYLGLRFLINGLKHYGWARIEVTSPSEWIVKDYAYNATPNEAIITGEMVLSWEEANHKEVKIIVSHKNVSVYNLVDYSNYNLYALNGQKIIDGHLEKFDNKINFENLNSGLYVIELIAENSAFPIKRKVLIH
ncbi:Por secretion system C-terminal sorting domain-containing protein [Flavobacteriaceae bacterium MAR_2010_188]|nr:Por secretion system C-terminal sorting domain-containing protein [Flavobacteriaceae bacterium MAR_2010_188]